MNSPEMVAPPVPPPVPPVLETPLETTVLVCAVDSTKLTFGEWWRTSPGLVAVIGWCSKLLRARILDSVRTLIVRDAAAFEISVDELSDEARRKILSQVEALRSLGFGEPRVMRMTDVFTNREIVLAAQLHESGKTLARTMYAYPLAEATSKKKDFLVGFLSALSDGRLLCTDPSRPKFLCSPRILARWKRGSLAGRYKAHEENIRQVGDASVLSLTAEGIWPTCDHYENTATAFQQSRGLYVPLSDAEGAKVAAIASPEEARLAGALAELVRLQTERPRSIAGVVMLVISLAVFAAAGAWRWSWQICAIIGIALFVHEVGHYVAMRLFKYRDLRMFFIPLLGAAVIGKHHNVPGWKKAIVSLMGPLPGIFIGTGMAICAVVLGQPAVANAALIVIALNLFNLLPILPLDGGWFWNAVLFCRHRWLEAGFKSLAAFALMGSGLLGGGIWFVLGIGMLRGVPKTLRLGAAAARLRARGWQPASDDIISRETAETILSELKQPGKNPPAAKTAAAEALNVFEHLNARPPNFLGSFGLAAIYGATVLVALIGLGAAVSAESGSRHKTTHGVRNSLEQTTVLNAEFHGEVARFPDTRGSDDKTQSGRRLIATFPDSKSAAAVLQKVRAEKISADRLVQFGQTLIAVTAFEDKTTARELGERFRQEGATLLDTGSPLTFALLNLQFSAPDAESAARLSRDLHAYFGLPVGLRPLAPWAHDAAVKPEQREQHMQAAATYARILEAQALCDKSPELAPFRRTSTSIFTLFQSRKAALASAQDLMAKQYQLHREAVKKLKASGDPTLDDRVMALALRQPRLVNRAQFEAVEKWHDEMRELLTGHREDDREMSPDRFVSAQVAVTGQQITLRFVSFPTPEQTLPALAQYFGSFACTDVRYGFYDVQIPEARRLAALDR